MKQNNQEIEQYRVNHPKFEKVHGNNGLFQFKGPRGLILTVIASDGLGWDHVSVEVEPGVPGAKQRLPWWDEMCFVKNLFWDEEEPVIQIHPPKSMYVNVHPYVLHLWKPQKVEIPLPWIMLV